VLTLNGLEALYEDKGATFRAASHATFHDSNELSRSRFVSLNYLPNSAGNVFRHTRHQNMSHICTYMSHIPRKKLSDMSPLFFSTGISDTAPLAAVVKLAPSLSLKKNFPQTLRFIRKSRNYYFHHHFFDEKLVKSSKNVIIRLNLEYRPDS
jgi:hypothetical protein